MSEKIRVLIVEPGKYPRPASITKKLETYQDVVGGYIECIYPSYADKVGLVCNEEGKLDGLPLNRALRFEDSGKVYDVIAGTFFIVGLSDDDFRSLTDNEIETFDRLFHNPESFIINQEENAITVVPLKREIDLPNFRFIDDFDDR